MSPKPSAEFGTKASCINYSNLIPTSFCPHQCQLQKKIVVCSHQGNLQSRKNQIASLLYNIFNFQSFLPPKTRKLALHDDDTTLLYRSTWPQLTNRRSHSKATKLHWNLMSQMENHHQRGQKHCSALSKTPPHQSN